MRTVRVLPGEPLSVDLVNTVWLEHGEPVDALRDLEGVRAWIDLQGIDCPATEAARVALLEARTAIRAHIDAPESPSARAALNTVLSWGSRRPVLTAQDVEVLSTTEDRARLAAWLAAVNYVELRAVGQFRRCDHDQCVLYFHDTSARGSRRWCSMAQCGNRAKAARHYARSRKS